MDFQDEGRSRSEAAAVLGPGTTFIDGVEGMSGKVRISLLCEFMQDERTLKVQATKTLGDKTVWETMRELSKGTIEPGLGDYAYSAVGSGKPTVADTPVLRTRWAPSLRAL